MANGFKPKPLRQANGYDTKQASDEAAALTPYDPVSLTVQSQAEDADINVLMRRYGITGQMPDNPRIPTFGDFSEITDYRSALDAVRNAHEGFMELPAELRAKFDNDPQLLLAFCADERNYPEAEKLGLVKPKPVESPGPALGEPVGQPPATPPAAPVAPGAKP